MSKWKSVRKCEFLIISVVPFSVVEHQHEEDPVRENTQDVGGQYLLRLNVRAN